MKFSFRKKLLLFIFTFSKVTLVSWDKLCCVKKTSPGKILLFLVAGKWNWWWRVYSNLCLLCSHHPCILCLHHPRLLCFYYPRLLCSYQRPHSFNITHKFYQSGIKNHYFFKQEKDQFALNSKLTTKRRRLKSFSPPTIRP